MNINNTNYQEFIVDFYDNRLSSAQQEELLTYLDNNPACKEEFDAFAEITITPDTTISIDKNLFKKSIIPFKNITEDNYKELLIHSIDNNLSNEDKENLSLFRKENPDLEQEFMLAARLKLEADKSIIHPDKDSLKKSVIIPLFRRVAYYSAGIAAAFLLFFFVFNDNQGGSDFINRDHISAAINNPDDEKVSDDKADNITNEPLNKDTKENVTNKISENGSISQIKNKIIAESQPHTQEQYSVEENKSNTPNNKKLEQDDLVRFANLEKMDSRINNLSITEKTHFYEAEIDPINHFSEIAMNTENKEDNSNSNGLFKRLTAAISNNEENLFKNINLWSLADLSVEGLSYLASSDMDIQKSTDSNKNTTTYSLNTGSVSVKHSIKKR